ncbi:MAG: hypothetical protein ABFD89_10000 [Bryobacteraceae bacterium]
MSDKKIRLTTDLEIDQLEKIAGLRARVAELETALGETLDPLDLYNAYGWQDRNQVRAKIRVLLNHYPVRP